MSKQQESKPTSGESDKEECLKNEQEVKEQMARKEEEEEGKEFQ